MQDDMVASENRCVWGGGGGGGGGAYTPNIMRLLFQWFPCLGAAFYEKKL